MEPRLIITILVQAYIFILLCGITGGLLIYLSSSFFGPKNSGTIAFSGVSFVAGLIFFVTAYALIKTGGNSVFIFTIPVSILLLMAARRNENPGAPVLKNSETGVKTAAFGKIVLRTTFFFAILSLFVFAQLSFFEGDDWVAFPPSDNSWYADVIENLKRNGAENLQGQFVQFNNSELLREPYHFFELWLTAGFSDITGISSFFSFMIVPVVVLGTITMLVITQLFEKISVDPVWLWIVPLVIFWGPLKIGDFIGGGDLYHNLSFPVPKYQVFQLFLFSFFNLLVTRSSVAAIFILYLPIATFTALVPVCGGLGLIAVFNLFQHKNIPSAIKEIISPALFFVMILAYYIINQSFHPLGGAEYSAVSVSDLGGDWKMRLNITGAAFLFPLFFFSPLLLLGFLFFRISGMPMRQWMDKSLKKILLFTIGGSISGLLCWLLLMRKLDSSQLYQNFLITAVSVFLSCCIIKAMAAIRFSFTIRSLAALLLFLGMSGLCIAATFNINMYTHPLTAVQRVSKVFLEKGERFLKNQKEPVLIATANTAVAYLNRFNRNEKVYTPCFALKRNNPGIIGLSITGDEALKIPLTHPWDESFQKIVQHTPFVTYLNKEQVDVSDTASVNLKRLAFMRDNGIGYLVTVKGFIIPNYLKEYITADFVSDHYTGITLYKLRLNQD